MSADPSAPGPVDLSSLSGARAAVTSSPPPDPVLASVPPPSAAPGSGPGSHRQLPVPVMGDRSLFSRLRARAYLTHASISPLSDPVVEALSAITLDYAERGVVAFKRWDDQRLDLKADLAALINARASEIALLPGTSAALTAVALGVPWRSGDRVLLFDGEFPANVTPWQRAAELFDLELVYHPVLEFLGSPSRALERLADELSRGVRLVAVSAVQFATGLRMPMEDIGALCRAHGAELCVDGIQACGVMPTDVGAWQADYFACGAHKFLMGVEGAGFLWVHPDRVAAMRPYVAGWLSHEDGAEFLFRGPGHLRYDRPLRRTADVFEGGTLPAQGFAALGASVRLIRQLGTEAIEAHVQGYLDELEDELARLGFRSFRSQHPAGRSCSLSVRPPTDISVVALHAALRERGIITALPDGYLRFAPHWPNSLREIPEVVAALRDALAAISG